MIFNRGFLCPNCGPVKEVKKVAATKYLPARNLCPTCGENSTPWVRPIQERAGRCGCCAGAAFTSAIVKRHMMRCCKVCGEVIDIDDNNKLVRKGDSKHAFNKTL